MNKPSERHVESFNSKNPAFKMSGKTWSYFGRFSTIRETPDRRFNSMNETNLIQID